MGRRIRQTTYDGSSGSYVMTEDLKFVSDGWNLLAELAAVNNAIVRSYVWGSDLSGTFRGAGGVGGLLAMSYRGTATTNTFVAYDGNGNVAALVNAADGRLVARYEYDPFGNLLRATGPMAKLNPVRFSTKYQDDQTSLLYYGYRCYNATTGGWLSRDPLGEQGGPNSYAFIANDGIGALDILGLARALAGFVYYMENPELGPPGVTAKYIGSAEILQNRLTMTHTHNKLLFNKGTSIKIAPVFAEKPAGGWTRRNVNRILRSVDESWIRSLPEGLRTEGLLNKDAALTDEKIEETAYEFGPTQGEQITAKVSAINRKTSSVTRTTEVGEEEIARPEPRPGISEGAANVALMGVDAIITGFIAYSSLCHYAKENNISTAEAELTQKWQQVLQAGFNRTPNERMELDGYMYDPAGTGSLYPIGKGAGNRLLEEWQLYPARVFVFDTTSDVLTIRTTPGWQNLP